MKLPCGWEQWHHLEQRGLGAQRVNLQTGKDGAEPSGRHRNRADALKWRKSRIFLLGRRTCTMTRSVVRLYSSMTTPNCV
jgi:hypothetical protein